MMLNRASVAILAASSLAESLTLTVSSDGGNASSPLLYGFMFEDINHSGDGGIHGQLLRNNGFQGSSPGLTAWSATGDVTISVDTTRPLSSALPQSLRVDVPTGSTGQVGVSNEGYWGIPVTAQTYAAYFWVEGNYSGPIEVQVNSTTTGGILGSATTTVEAVTSNFTYYTTLVDVAGSGINFGLPQFFPVTYHTRYNGLKPDIANALEDVKASFLRFPGGNNIEGDSTSDRWIWYNTVGPVEDRPGRQGDWSYPNTDALGLLEYLYWCEDMGLAPVMAVWSGYALNGDVVTGSDLDEYVQDAVNQIEYVVGNTSTQYGALRASHGREAPFSLSHVEIGNEDFVSGSVGTYATRFTSFYNAITAAYPGITVIASTPTGLPSPLPSDVVIDVHYYEAPDTFVRYFNLFDNANRSNGYFVGEYACTKSNSGSTNYYPTVIGAVAEAVFMIGLERNSDLVKMASYAPLLQHFNSTQWNPDLVGYNSNPADLTLSTSYYVQQMFSVNRGTTILPVSADGDFGPVYWVASRNDDTSTYYVKLANYNATATTATIVIDGVTSGTVTTLTGPDESSKNEPGDSGVVVPVSESITASDGSYTVNLPAYAVVVVALN